MKIYPLGNIFPKDIFSIDFIGEHIMNTSTQQPKFAIYQNVTDRIVKALETGTAPWLSENTTK